MQALNRVLQHWSQGFIQVYSHQLLFTLVGATEAALLPFDCGEPVGQLAIS